MLLSVRATAQKLGTDSAFLLRTVKQLGFDGYAEFKTCLHERALVDATSFERLRATSAEGQSAHESVHAALRKSQEHLAELKTSLDAKQVIALARKLHGARMVYLLGADLAAPVVDYLRYQMVMVGLAPIVLSGHGETLHSMRSVTDKDVVLAVTFRRGLRITVNGLRDARNHGAYTVAITDRSSNAIAQLAHEHFLAEIEGAALRSSFVAAFALVDALISACANVKRVRTLKLLSEGEEEQLYGYRWYEPNS